MFKDEDLYLQYGILEKLVTYIYKLTYLEAVFTKYTAISLYNRLCIISLTDIYLGLAVKCMGRMGGLIFLYRID